MKASQMLVRRKKNSSRKLQLYQTVYRIEYRNYAPLLCQVNSKLQQNSFQTSDKQKNYSQQQLKKNLSAALFVLQIRSAIECNRKTNNMKCIKTNQFRMKPLHIVSFFDTRAFSSNSQPHYNAAQIVYN